MPQLERLSLEVRTYLGSVFGMRRNSWVEVLSFGMQFYDLR